MNCESGCVEEVLDMHGDQTDEFHLPMTANQCESLSGVIVNMSAFPILCIENLPCSDELFRERRPRFAQFCFDMALAADVLHDIHGTRDLTLVAKGYRGIQNGLLGPVQALDLDNLAHCRLALLDGTCDGPLVTLDRLTGIRPPAAIVFVVS